MPSHAEDRLRFTAKVKGLLAKADSTTFEEEREAYLSKATALRLKYGISDADVAAAEIDEDLELFGFNLLLYSRVVGDHLERIEAEVREVITKTRTMSDADRLNLLSRFYRDILRAIDNDYRPSLKQHRDDAIRAVYKEAVAAYHAEHLQWHEEQGTDPTPDVWLRTQAHEHALFRVRMAENVNLRRSTVESIVKVKRKDLWEAELRAHTCDRCGLDGYEGREPVGLFDEGDERLWLHAECRTEAAS